MRNQANMWQSGVDQPSLSRLGHGFRRVLGRHRVMAAGTLLFVLLGTSSAAAAERGAGDPGTFVASVGQQVIAALSTAAESERTRHFRNIFVRALDLDSIAKRSLGRHWRKASAAERERYLTLFRDYVVNIYAVQLGGYAGEHFAVLRQQPSSDAESTVTARISREFGAPLDLSFKVTSTDFGYKIVDVVVGGVSLVVTKRSEFDAIIRREGLPGLLRRLDDKSTRARIEQARSMTFLAEAVTVLHSGRALLFQ